MRLAKSLTGLVAATAMLTAVTVTEVKANPVLVTIPAWVIVTTLAVFGASMVAAIAVAKKRGCHGAIIDGRSVWVCPN